jgi:hypothetical protein
MLTHVCDPIEAVSLDSKSRSDRPEKFSDRDTVTSDESNVNESNLQEFEGVNVSTGRTGQNGGGTNAVSKRACLLRCMRMLILHYHIATHSSRGRW